MFFVRLVLGYFLIVMFGREVLFYIVGSFICILIGKEVVFVILKWFLWILWNYFFDEWL